MARQLQYKNSYNFGELLTRRRTSHSALALSSGGNTTYYPYVVQSLDTLLEGGETLGYAITDTTPKPATMAVPVNCPVAVCAPAAPCSPPRSAKARVCGEMLSP
ncbi:hypothetical protein [Microbulbifer spongiae]|uniref:Uncharacterized protein n=1 Tax=Microbulbifer spongiae TaxID=2944933 RepID=A0ABY9EG71_9GAMM|nr:hypothetical protein [Microbulbifer sp. MI-G]WKD50579.1 hypothetical protein M8T91_03900 [Microbulbifer sp. MI-G]